MRKLFYLLLITTIFLSNSSAQGYLHSSGKTIVDGSNNEIILHGIGIGGWMLQEGYMYGNSGNFYTQHAFKAKLAALIGSVETEKFYTNWRDNFMQQRDMDSIAAWGFNSIRVPMHYNLFRRCFTADPQNDEGFRLIDNLVTWAAAKNIYVILDMHGTPGGQGDDTGISDRDATKPYLWTSVANQDTLVQIWKNIAIKYANQPLIGGYDLINETNYAPMKPTNALLRNMYGRLTDTIRHYDNNHILFVEGNDYANNFTGLTPAWDANMAYSFHKYWNGTDVGTLQGMIDMRNTTNRPLWLGETGENGNAWFTAVVKTLEANKIGYSNWSYKPYDKIQSPICVKPFANWDKVISYVNNSTALSASDCIAYLKEMTDGLLLQNCKINKDEIDAWTRQPYDNSTKAFAPNAIPGILFAVNYDLGTQGFAYNDKVVQTLAQNPWTAWNNGYVYRNDGVDIQACTDTNPYNLGYNVGWTDDNEWLLFSVNVNATGVYDLNLRCANGATATGSMHVEIDNVDVTGTVSISATGGWNIWNDFPVTGISLTAGEHKMKVIFDKAGFNINALNWTVSSNPVVFRLLSAKAINDTTIRLAFNKPLNTTIAPNISDFTINSTTPHAISSMSYDASYPYYLLIHTSNYVFYNETLTLDYSGTSLESTDADKVIPMVKNVVTNMIPARYQISGKLEAENYLSMSGIQTETTTDVGAGQNIGYTNVGDELEYLVYVAATDDYKLTFRMAGNGGKANLYYSDPNNQNLIGTVTFTATGGWQTWKDFVVTANLTAGAHTLKLTVVNEGFNLNYITFAPSSTSLQTNLAQAGFDFYPNPATNDITITYDVETTNATLEILDLQGVVVLANKFDTLGLTTVNYSIRDLMAGVYIVRITDGNKLITKKMVVKK